MLNTMVVRFRCSIDDYDILRREAAKRNMNMSELFRFLIRREALSDDCNIIEEVQIKDCSNYDVRC